MRILHTDVIRSPTTVRAEPTKAVTVAFHQLNGDGFGGGAFRRLYNRVAKHSSRNFNCSFGLFATAISSELLRFVIPKSDKTARAFFSEGNCGWDSSRVGARHSNLNSVVAQAAHTNDYEHRLLLEPTSDSAVRQAAASFAEP